MSPREPTSRPAGGPRDRFLLVSLALASGGIYAALARAGDLRERLPLFLAAHAALALLMLAAWRGLRRDTRSLPLVLLAAALFRIVAAFGEPALSDDVYRYVWDGRVQLHGFHPYRHAPDDPALAGLRDGNWARINHPQLGTIYPPLAQWSFLALAAAGAGPFGFKLAMASFDFGVVLLLVRLLGRLGVSRSRVVLYAWNPLAVLESGGSGHVEPLGVLLVLLAGGWIIDRRFLLSTLPLAAGIHVKLFPLVLVPAALRRYRLGAVLLLLSAVSLPLAIVARGGPALGAGLFAYAGRWEHNAFVFAGARELFTRLDLTPLLKRALEALQRGAGSLDLPWDWLYRHVWPGDLARAFVVACALAWLLYLSLARRPEIAREFLLALGGLLLLSPTVHPWYVLWVLPWAVACRSPGWLLFSLTVPLAYCGGPGDVGWSIRLVEYGPPLGLMAARALRARLLG